jgi:hypothetical protein
MAIAMLFPDGGKGGRGKKGNPAETAGFSGRRLGEARQVLRFSYELACGVRDTERPRAMLAARAWREFYLGKSKNFLSLGKKETGGFGTPEKLVRRRKLCQHCSHFPLFNPAAS